MKAIEGVAMLSELSQELLRLRKERPLVHNITNYVVMNTTANALLAIGASPIMAHAVEELSELINYASALVINIGTLDDVWIKGMIKAAQLAHQKKIPVILDPVGASATALRLSTSKQILPYTTLVKGNLSELLALVGAETEAKGVDSEKRDQLPVEQLKELLKFYPQLTICCSGKDDLILSSQGAWQVHNGHPMMEMITGMGCTLSALCGAFAGILKDQQDKATILAVLSLTIAGEMAVQRTEARGPGSLQTAIIDALYQLTPKDIEQMARITKL